MHAIKKKLAQWLTEPEAAETLAPTMSPAQYGVSGWLSGDKAKLSSLLELLHARIEGRGQMPIPSNPHDAVVRLSADAEARMIMSELTFIATRPVASTNQGIEEK
jgi:hypothetical protein